MQMRCWDVVRVDFPFAEQPTARPRPALVVATPAATDAFALVWVIMITSARHAPWPEDVAITDLTSTGLPHASLIRTAKIATIDQRLVTTIGHLSIQDRHAVRAGLNRQLGDALTF